MKKLYFFYFVFFSFLIAQQKSIIVENIISQINIDSLKQHVKELSGETSVNINGTNYTITSRHSNNAMNDIAANYIEMKLASYGLQVFNHNYDSNGRNVYAVQLGSESPNEQYIICAHYDNMPSFGNAPGADDNASGTSAVIEAARILSQYETKKTIIYALWDEEEQGLIGSYYYASRAATQNENIKGVLNLDMIAWDNNNDGRINIHTRSTANSTLLSSKMIEVKNTYSIPLTYFINNPGSSYSDHASFWQKGFPAILLIEDDYYNDFNNYYHTSNDKLQFFNTDFFHNCSKLAIATLAELAEINDVVPVELISFSAEQNNKSVLLSWETATETNNLGFEIERQNLDFNEMNTLDNQWQKVGFAAGQGNSSNPIVYSFTDDISMYVNQNTSVSYRLKQIDFDGEITYSDVINLELISLSPKEFVLEQNYPNPFNPTTTIKYSVPSVQSTLTSENYNSANVALKVYDIIGNEVATLVDEPMASGTYEVSFDASALSSGIYFYILRINNDLKIRKMSFLK